MEKETVKSRKKAALKESERLQDGVRYQHKHREPAQNTVTRLRNRRRADHMQQEGEKTMPKIEDEEPSTTIVLMYMHHIASFELSSP